MYGCLPFYPSIIEEFLGLVEARDFRFREIYRYVTYCIAARL